MLCRRVAERDEAAFDLLVARYQGRAYRLAWSMVRDAEDARDLSQEAFLRVYRTAQSFRGDARFSTWIYRVLVNSCYDMLRHRRRRPVEVREDGETSRAVAESAAPASDHSLRLSLETCVKELDPRRRAAFLLFAVEGFTHREVGDILGVPEGTSKTLLFEAKRELQRRLAKPGMAARAGA